MFHDELIPADERAKFQDGYKRMADAVNESLQSYLSVLGKVFETYHASGLDTHLAPVLLLMEYAEPIDGVAILARAGSAKNCVPLIRTGFELQLNLMYMLERDNVYESRCLAYEYFHWLKQHATAQKADPTTALGKQVRGQMKREPLSDLFDDPTCDIAAEIAQSQKNLDDPRYATVKSKYDATTTKLNHWYAMWDGPKSLEELAGKLNMRGRYEIMYRYWSGFAHGNSAMKRLTDAGPAGTGAEMEAIRSPKGLPIACLNACNLANEMASFLVDRVVPDFKDECAARYLTRVKPGLDYLKTVKGL